MLHSFGLRFKPWVDYAQILRSEINRQSKRTIRFDDHSLLNARLSQDKSDAPFVDYLQTLYAEKPPDLIIATGAPAANFVQRYRSQLFPATPMLFTAVEARRVQSDRLTENDTVAAAAHDFPSRACRSRWGGGAGGDGARLPLRSPDLPSARGRGSRLWGAGPAGGHSLRAGDGCRRGRAAARRSGVRLSVGPSSNPLALADVSSSRRRGPPARPPCGGHEEIPRGDEGESFARPTPQRGADPRLLCRESAGNRLQGDER